MTVSHTNRIFLILRRYLFDSKSRYPRNSRLAVKTQLLVYHYVALQWVTSYKSLVMSAHEKKAKVIWHPVYSLEIEEGVTEPSQERSNTDYN